MAGTHRDLYIPNRGEWLGALHRNDYDAKESAMRVAPNVEQLTHGDHGQKKLFVLPLRYVQLQFQPPPLRLYQDTGID